MRSKIGCIIILNYYLLEGFLLMETKMAIDKKALNKLRFFLAGVFALTFVGIVLRSLSLLFFFDSYIGYFAVGALLPILTNIFFLVAAVLILVLTLLLPKDAPYISGQETPISIKVASALCAVASLVIAPVHFITWIGNSSFLWTCLIPLLLLVSAGYFALNIINQKAEFKPFGALLLVLLFVFYLAMSYFDVFVQMNSPNKIMMHMSCLALMLFFMSEARCVAGAMKKKLYIFSTSVAIFFVGVEAIPSIIAIISSKMTTPEYLSYDILLCPILLYLITRAALMMRIPAEEAAPEEVLVEDSEDEITDNTEESTDLQEGI